MNLSPPMEDYLEAVQVISNEQGSARVKDLAKHLSVSDSSVVAALRVLKARRLVLQEPYGSIRLTKEGRQIAGEVLHRHEVLASFLEEVLGLDADTAAQDACRIEHTVSPATFSRLKALDEFLRGAAHPDLEWTREFREFCERRESGAPGPVTLDKVEEGRRNVVREVRGGLALRQRLGGLGIHPGDEVTVRRAGSWGGPVLIEVHGAEVAIGQGQARRILVTPAAESEQ